MDYVNWVFEHYGDLIAILIALHAVALLIVNLTPTPKDDEFVAKAYKIIEFLGGIISAKAKQ